MLTKLPVVETQNFAPLLRAVLISEMMKRLFIYFVLFLCLFVLKGCNLKHKWRNKQKENTIHRKQEYLSHLLTTEHLVLDTSLQYSHTQLKHYKLWHLSGNVQIHPDGSLLTDQALLESWHSEVDSHQMASSSINYQNQRVEEERLATESIDINKKSTYKEKRKASLNLWWLVLLLPLLLVWSYRRIR